LEIAMSKSPRPAVQSASVFEDLMRTDVSQWKGVVGRLKDPVTARLVVKFLDDHPQLREKRAGVYLAASETVQRDRIRYAKAMRAGRAAAVIARTLLKAGKAVMGLGRSSAAGRRADAVPVTVPTVATAAVVSIPAPRHSMEDLVFPVIVDPLTGQPPLFH
jgi:hypothetical protein